MLHKQLLSAYANHLFCRFICQQKTKLIVAGAMCRTALTFCMRTRQYRPWRTSLTLIPGTGREISCCAETLVFGKQLSSDVRKALAYATTDINRHLDSFIRRAHQSSCFSWSSQLSWLFREIQTRYQHSTSHMQPLWTSFLFLEDWVTVHFLSSGMAFKLWQMCPW